MKKKNIKGRIIQIMIDSLKPVHAMCFRFFVTTILITLNAVFILSKILLVAFWDHSAKISFTYIYKIKIILY